MHRTQDGVGERKQIVLFNVYLYVETDNSRTWSSVFHFHITFLVVEILNQRQLIKYAQISDKWPFLQGIH